MTDPETIVELITPPSDDYVNRDHWTYKLIYYAIFFSSLYALHWFIKWVCHAIWPDMFKS